MSAHRTAHGALPAFPHPAAGAQRVYVHINVLALRGFAAAQGPALSAGLVAELERRLAEPGALAALDTGRAFDVVRASPLTVASATLGAHLGSMAGATIARSLVR